MKPFMLTGFLLFVFMTLPPNGAMPMDLSRLAAHKTGGTDRDLRVLTLFHRGPSRLDDAPLEREAADAIRNRFDVPRDRFTLILVGKDGAIKLERDERTGPDDIFALIDAMPMRQNEMRRKNRRP